jgi:hypothetical protein
MGTFQGFYQTIGNFRIKAFIHLAFPITKNKVFGFNPGHTHRCTGAASKTGKDGSFGIFIQRQLVFDGKLGNGIASPGTGGFFPLDKVGWTAGQAETTLGALEDLIIGQFFQLDNIHKRSPLNMYSYDKPSPINQHGITGVRGNTELEYWNNGMMEYWVSRIRII